MSDVYLVRLPEGAHNWLIGLAADVDTSWMSPGNQDIARDASSALESARPEHPERQRLLEELAEKVHQRHTAYLSYDLVAAEEAELAAYNRLRSLEGKS